MHKKIISKPSTYTQNSFCGKTEIAIHLPGKYCENPDELLHLDKTEENALFSYLVNEFFRQIEKSKILAGESISELSFLCESYFDFQELKEEMNYSDEFETSYSEY